MLHRTWIYELYKPEALVLYPFYRLNYLTGNGSSSSRITDNVSITHLAKAFTLQEEEESLSATLSLEIDPLVQSLGIHFGYPGSAALYPRGWARII